MKRKISACLLFIGFTLLSCQLDEKQSYAIDDFDKSLQPSLITIVSNGVVQWDSAARFIEKHATDEDLNKLCKSEHPVLRAVALRTSLQRTTLDHFKIIMSNLSDTAVVAVLDGEWGIKYRKVSDDMLNYGKWKDSAAINKTIDELLTNHTYLSSAYTKLPSITPNEKYYHFIKQMAEREEEPIEENQTRLKDISFWEKEHALYALAKFKKPGDIEIIKQILQENLYQLGAMSFRLMKEYPSEEYNSIFENYYSKKFYRRLCIDKRTDIAINFIDCIAVYKNEQSSKILNAMLTRKPFIPCSEDSDYIKQDLQNAIWDNNCPVYQNMRKSIKQIMLDRKKRTFEMPVEKITLPPDTSKEPVYW